MSNTTNLAVTKTEVSVTSLVPNIFEGLNKAITAHWEALRRAPGAALSRLEKAGAGWRIRYQNGAIYTRNGTRAHWVYGAIGLRYDALGGANSWLGMPITDEMDFVEGGRLTVFENGSIYWWPDTRAIELRGVAVHYTGLGCFGETDFDGGSDSDEPYGTIGVNVPGAPPNIFRTAIYEDVDGGETRPDLIEIYRGQPRGLVINVVLQEHSNGDTQLSRAAMEKAVAAGATALTAATAMIPVVGPVLAIGVGFFFGEMGGPIVEALNSFLESTLGYADRPLGTDQIVLTPKQMILLATRPEGNAEFKGIGWRFETNLLSRFGASYKLYFGIVPT